MIFPKLSKHTFGYVNLDLEARQWAKEKKLRIEPNPFLDPEMCDQMIKDVHQKYNLDFSYGGWMEDRSFLWKGSYLDQYNTYIHLGMDINVSAQTEVASLFDGEVILVDDDFPEQGGWGPRIIIKNITESIYLLYAHLDRDIKVRAGDLVKKDQIIAKVGKAPQNGNWFQHLHVQLITEEYWKEMQKDGLFSELDGYGTAEDVEINKQRFPDPTRMFLS